MAHRGSCFAIVLMAGLGVGCGSSSTGTTDIGSGGAGGSAGSGGALSDGSAGGSAGSGGALPDGSAGGSAGSGGTNVGGGAGTGGLDGGAKDGGGGHDGGEDAEGGGCVTLTVKNYLSWCSVSVAGAAAVSTAEQTACVAPGAVALTATALTGFKLGTTPWHRTDGDQGSGEQGTITGQESKATVTVGGPACVWVCCEFAAGGGCPTANQCP